jgi:hypothetical protein
VTIKRSGSQPVVLKKSDAGSRRKIVAAAFAVDRGQERAPMLRKLLLLVLIVASTPTFAQPPLPLPFPPLPLPMPQGTPEERAACQGDVHKYCESYLPDVLQVGNCLQANKARLSPACRQVLINHGM